MDQDYFNFRMDGHSPRIDFWSNYVLSRGHMIFHQKHGYSRKKQKTQKQETELDAKSKRQLEIEKMIHPHDDPPDPTAHMGDAQFPTNALCFFA